MAWRRAHARICVMARNDGFWAVGAYFGVVGCALLGLGVGTGVEAQPTLRSFGGCAEAGGVLAIIYPALDRHGVQLGSGGKVMYGC